MEHFVANRDGSLDVSCGRVDAGDAQGLIKRGLEMWTVLEEILDVYFAVCSDIGGDFLSDSFQELGVVDKLG